MQKLSTLIKQVLKKEGLGKRRRKGKGVHVSSVGKGVHVSSVIKGGKKKRTKKGKGATEPPYIKF